MHKGRVIPISLQITVHIPLKRPKPRRPSRKTEILRVLKAGDPGGMTSEEIGEKLALDGIIPDNLPSFIRPRLSELRREGKVVVTGRRYSEPSQRKRVAVWRASDG